MEVNGINYLIPVYTKLERDIDIEDEAVSLDRVLLPFAQPEISNRSLKQLLTTPYRSTTHRWAA